MVFLADGIGVRLDDKPAGSTCRSRHNVELEPLTLLSALAPLTKHIGLVATASTTYNEPYHIARKYASLDQAFPRRCAPRSPKAETTALQPTSGWHARTINVLSPA
jgi:alkanesulfonate monooxygenase SsuD/methylene tetrahydromethanopterin reductase-like flavin-dependent oxidoreductase (luciferase family)